MESYDVQRVPEGLAVRGPWRDDAPLIALKGRAAERLADWALHLGDLYRARAYLDRLRNTDHDDKVMIDSLWDSSLVRFFKCFQGAKSRSPLDADAVFGDATSERVSFEELRAIRNKHLVHDENALAQAHPFAVLADEDAGYNVERVAFVAAIEPTLTGQRGSTAVSLVTRAIEWVEQKIDLAVVALSDELEHVDRQELAARSAPILIPPNAIDIYKPR